MWGEKKEKRKSALAVLEILKKKQTVYYSSTDQLSVATSSVEGFISI